MKSRLALSLLVALGSLATLTTASHAEDKVPLKLDLPKPLFVGTPRPISLPNLEKPRVGRRPDFMVPVGTVLLSKNKPVTASDSFPVIGDLSYLTDGDKSGDEGSYVELGPGLQWAQIDLGAPAKLAAIVVWHYHSQARAYHDVIVQVSDDPNFKTGVTTLFNNDDDNSSGLGKGSDLAYIETYEGRLIDAKETSARYVRLYSNGNTSDELNHYVEVEVYGQKS
ncbi:MAG TPA: discoidin domain-containing protein [Opitutus sp.]|nr:discoidin domain-containing protein [Opitutus sp.]